MNELEIPLIIRGQVIRDNWVSFPGRHGSVTLKTPDVKAYIDQIVLKNPSDLKDLYAITMDEILDYLDELGQRLDPAKNPHMRTAMEVAASTSGHSPEMLNYMYRNMTNILRRDFVAEALEQNVGLAHLEGWVRTSLHDRATAVRAYGARAVHINAGNGAVITLQGVMTNAVLRSDAIMKNPSNDPYTGTAIALTMIEMAPDHPLTKHLTVAYWKGGDAAFESKLYRPTNVEKIVAWGGFASMEHIRAYVGPGMDLIALDPKISGSMIGREAFADSETMRKVAASLAKDVGYFNQEGCISARVVYAQSGTDPNGLDRLTEFGKLVNEEIAKLPVELSSPHPAFDRGLREEIDGIRYSNAFRIIGCQGDDGGVIVSLDPEPVDFSDNLGCRVVNLVPVDEIDEALAHVTIHTAAIGIYPDELKEAVREECALRGAQRLTSLGFATAEGAAQPHDAMEPMRRMARWVVMEEFQVGQSENTGWVHGGS
ncbi:acyl-CoA reductase [Rhizorhabdus argentea]|uniref:acyl-CoA reductase n=1 Tax=Rhizorhabdus argentea TaxID=1387174 RepID=UPI0030ECD8E7